MLREIGFALIVVGVLVALFGDYEISSKTGLIGHLFAWPKGRATLLKGLVGLALIFSGIMFVISK